MLRLVTGYFVWDLAVWLSIFVFSALLLVSFVRYWKKKYGLRIEAGVAAPERPLSALGRGRMSGFLRESLLWWLERDQAQLLLFAAILLFFTAALLAAPQGGAGR